MPRGLGAPASPTSDPKHESYPIVSDCAAVHGGKALSGPLTCHAAVAMPVCIGMGAVVRPCGMAGSRRLVR